MGILLKLKPIINKKNGQINVSLPKKKMPRGLTQSTIPIKRIKFRLEGWE
jgi:hypothetical protein